ncbi:DUF1501 domain-containing protein [Aquincola sp. S2]|uniref:DUF1501 domain-containing protein n=1 Tax=Pseudaquabacterium terrae TaxID=2732868 RepID=A0ABX2EFL0_9BURK|nr:DUF1501 domain-containing protein [Aquabacterium terrae]NRF67407.1 DUF1501 domain-containing protein [Aquabacterium terrae]
MTNHHHFPQRSRRRFLLDASALLGAASLGTAAHAQSPGYKALVCVFMLGGNDGHNMVVPLSTAANNAYRAIRGGLALPDANTQLATVTTPAGVPYGLNSGLNAIAPLWAQGKLAVVANVGMLARPTTRAQFLAGSVPLPSNLFSHSDQIQQMQTAITTGGGTGWAGRSADAMNAMNGTSRFPASISMAGSALFCAGNVVQSASLIPGFDLSADGMSAWPDSAAAAKRNALNQLLTMDSGLALVQAANKVRQDAISLNQLLAGTTGGAAFATPFPGTSLGQQLQQVARIIRLRGTTGINRQVFFCSLGGFDTHSAQSWAHWDLLRVVGEAMAAFHAATVEMGVANGVTTFTESDFGRTLQPSGSGTDHGWGNHLLVMGGAVRGGEMYGNFPMPALGGPDDAGSRGVLIPTTSLDQFGATLAKWFGVGPAAMAQVFPNLGYFSSADVGFMS